MEFSPVLEDAILEVLDFVPVPWRPKAAQRLRALVAAILSEAKGNKT